MEMKMYRWHKYLHEYHFPYHDFLKQYESYVNEIFDKERGEANKKSVQNVPLPLDHPITPFLIPKLIDIVTKNYYVSKPFEILQLGLYKQTHNDYTSVFHNHAFNPGITGVFYLNPPLEGEGGEIEFLLQNLDQKLTISPKPNALYLFPSWLYHAPLPQKTTSPRICFNWAYVSKTYPIHKISGDRW